MDTVKNFFDWKVDKKRTPIEALYPPNEIIMSWERRDVLYSFIGIYQIGLSIYYPNLFYRTDYQIKTKDTHQVFGVDYLVEKENDICRYQQYNKLNTVLEEKAFISIITEPGNIIPIWPGGNTDRGLRGYCFDIPEAVRALQQHAFNDLNCTAMWCGYYDGNEKSKRCQERMGVAG